MLFSSSLYAPRYHTISLLDAAKDGSLQEVWWALDRGEDVNETRRRGGSSPLMRASYQGHIGVVRLLLNVPDVDVDADSSCGHTALIHAVNNQNIETVRLLLVLGKAHVNQTGLYLSTALHYVACTRCTEIARMLLASPGINVHSPDQGRQTALDIAVDHGQWEIVMLIAEFCLSRRGL